MLRILRWLHTYSGKLFRTPRIKLTLEFCDDSYAGTGHLSCVSTQLWEARGQSLCDSIDM